jgi:hypothetical protein
MQELLEKVNVSSLNLDAVEACVSCDLGGMSKVLHGLLDLVKSHFARGFARSLTNVPSVMISPAPAR